MMSTTIFRLVGLILFICSSYSYAIGTTSELSITGPGLEAPLHTTAESLTSANVWLGNFVDWNAGPIEHQASESSMYRIHFWAKGVPDGVRMIYVVFFALDENSNRAIVCLPGETTRWYWVNMSTIVRGDSDGQCFYADEEWGRSVVNALQSAR